MGIRVSVKKLYENVLRRLLTEAKCPECGDNDAYIGATSVECPNKKCRFYSARQAADVKAMGKNKQDPRYAQVMRHVNVLGICDGDTGTFDYDDLDRWVTENGFERIGDFYFPVYASPHAWQDVAGPDAVTDPSLVIYTGHYDISYHVAVSADAKKIARALNDPKINPNWGNHDYLDSDVPDKMGHFDDLWMNPEIANNILGPCPDMEETWPEILGIERPNY